LPEWLSQEQATPEGGLDTRLEKAKASLQALSEEDRDWIFGKTAQTLYPKLAD
jgi:L-fuconolactonase